ncbi:MAG: sigma-54 dependent transcriptional regulator [Chitinispirillales bacterium]|jgi:DNA-binding NtrC family response regulator|nr:sigma-54 dependent transcriptional regulator [Chitinispirillales bacterium]
MRLKVLLADNEQAVQIQVARHLSDRGYDVFSAVSVDEVNTLLGVHSFDAVFLDVKLSNGDSINLIRDIRSKQKECVVIVISDISDVATAVHAMKSGAENFITKSQGIEGLKLFIQRDLELVALRKKDTTVRRLQMAPCKPYFGDSQQIKTVYSYAAIAAKNSAVVLLTGETGTGKGVLAKWIHDHSSVRAGNFVELNCSALKGDLLRSELYGHVKGSFTSAIKDRTGLIELARGGTLFLDEIGDMDMEVQAELLKTIEEKKFRRVGDNVLRSSDFRLICATNRDLKEMANRGTFRSDLYYRICVFPIEMPALRERHEDILGYTDYFLKAYSYNQFPLDKTLQSALTAYPWLGNIRELRNTIERALILSQGKNLEIDHFPGLKGENLLELIGAVGHQKEEIWDLNEIGRRHIQRALSFFKDKLKACQALGITQSALNQRLG